MPLHCLKQLLPIAAFTALILACQKGTPENGATPVDEDPVERPVEQPEDKPEAGEYRLPLIETTDIHGHIVYTENQTVQYRMAYVAGIVNDIRGSGEKYQKDRLLLVDGGDLYQGASISNLLSGRPVYISIDKMDYDAVALGNHEFDWGIENLIDSDATLPDYYWEGNHCANEVPVVCSNLYQNGSRVSWTKDYVIVEKSAVNAKGSTVKVKIGIVGFACNYASSIMTSKFSGRGFSIKEDYADANRIAASLETSGSCDATILLTHGAADYAAGQLGQNSAFDLVLGGHSHQTLKGQSAAGIPYLQGGRYCEGLAYAQLSFTVDEDGKLSFSGATNPKLYGVNPSDENHLSKDIVEVSDQALAAVSEQLNDVIGYIDVDATNYYISGSDGRASVIANWMCDITRRIGQADVAFVNSGGVRTSLPLNGQTRRNITVADIYEVFPFDNAIYIYSLTYAELLKVFEYSMTSSGGSLFCMMTGLDCRFSGYQLLSLAKDGTVIYQNHNWTGDWASRKVTLAVSEYLATNQRVDSYTGLGNPLLEWNSSARLLNNSQIDNESAVRVLREEAAASGGHLYIDTQPHFICTD